MWIISFCLEEGGTVQKYLLANPGSFTVGRKGCDIVIEDKSVSRNHASFSFDSPSSPILAVSDSSRFGTTVDGVVIPRGESVPVSSGAEVVVGSTRLSVDRSPLRLCFAASAGDSEEIESAKQAASRIGEIVTDATAMTHLVVASAPHGTAVTTRLLAALVRCVPIVTPRWVVSVASHAAPFRSALPDDDLPPGLDGEFTGVSLAPMQSRSAVFSRAAVVFLEAAQWKRMSAVVAAGGASPLMCGAGDPVPDTASFERVVVVEPQQDPLAADQRVSLLKKRGAKVVSETEIIRAIVKGTPLFSDPAAPPTISPAFESVRFPRPAKAAAAAKDEPRGRPPSPGGRKSGETTQPPQPAEIVATTPAHAPLAAAAARPSEEEAAKMQTEVMSLVQAATAAPGKRFKKVPFEKSKIVVKLAFASDIKSVLADEQRPAGAKRKDGEVAGDSFVVPDDFDDETTRPPKKKRQSN